VPIPLPRAKTAKTVLAKNTQPSVGGVTLAIRVVAILFAKAVIQSATSDRITQQ
jgi:hypothetical protein